MRTIGFAVCFLRISNRSACLNLLACAVQMPWLMASLLSEARTASSDGIPSFSHQAQTISIFAVSWHALLSGCTALILASPFFVSLLYSLAPLPSCQGGHIGLA
jgi:hypothetical protein